MSRKMQGPKSSSGALVDRESAWMIEEDAFMPLELSSKEREERTDRREANVTALGILKYTQSHKHMRAHTFIIPSSHNNIVLFGI